MSGSKYMTWTSITYVEGRHGGPGSRCCGPRRRRYGSLQTASTSITIFIAIVAMHTKLGAVACPVRCEGREVGGTLGAIRYRCKEAVVERSKRACGPVLLIRRTAVAHVIRMLESVPQRGCQGVHVTALCVGGPMYSRSKRKHRRVAGRRLGAPNIDEAA